jgi:hypothetical protein
MGCVLVGDLNNVLASQKLEKENKKQKTKRCIVDTLKGTEVIRSI